MPLRTRLAASVFALVTVLPATSAIAQFRYPPMYPYPGYRYTAEANLRLKVKPKEASVYVDGYFAGKVEDYDGAFERLHRQFITPFDRAEIHRLLGRIDDVLDLTDTTAERLLLYEVGTVPQAAKDLARVLVPATEKMQEAIRLLRDIKNPAQILTACREIKTLEGDADALGRAAIAALFKSGADALSIIKWKEIYDLMETATDRCEDVANVIEGVVLEHA